ncbi:MAG: hypothetical protein JNL65_11310 [Saprospiraceae bacterium]|nr:hypothetical protein [Saprospiraceae bacterium]
MAIFVLTGEIGTGKTTCLYNEIQNRLGIGGFLSPVKDNKRQFYLIRKRLYIPMEAKLDVLGSTLSVGRYRFDLNAFKKAKYQFSEDWNGGQKMVIMDEYGPLEFKNQGLLPELNTCLLEAQSSKEHHALVVVRSLLLDAFLNLYITDKVLYKEDLIKFFHEY